MSDGQGKDFLANLFEAIAALFVNCQERHRRTELVNRIRLSFLFYPALLAMALGAGILVFASTTSGVSTSPDSWNYLATSRNLLVGKAFYITDTRAYTQWTPLYPALLAVVYGISDMTGADVHILKFLRWSNALTFGATVLISARFFQQHLRSRMLIVIASLWVLVSLPILVVSTYAWADLLLVPLSILFVFYLTEILEHPKTSTLVILAILAALAALERHSGILLAGVGVVSMILWMRAAPFRTRLWYACLFGVGAGAPFALWLARCYQVSGQLAGNRGEPLASLRTNIHLTIDVLMHWFIPRELGVGYIKFTGAVILVLTLVVMLEYRRHGKFTLGGLERRPGVLPMLLLIIGHLIILVSSATFTYIMPIDDRYMAPIYPVVIVLIFMVIEQLQGWLSQRFQASVIKYAVPIVATVGLLVPIGRLNSEIPTLQAISKASNATYDTWRASDLIQQLKAQPPDGRIFTNAPRHVLIQTGIDSRAVPRSLEDWIPPEDVLSRSQPNYLVWFETIVGCDFERNFCIQTSYQLGDLKAIIGVQKEASAADGAVYRLADKPEN